MNGFGAFATGVTLLVVLVAKFAAGAWVTALLIPVMIAIMASVKRHTSGSTGRRRSMSPIEIGHIFLAHRGDSCRPLEQDHRERPSLRADAVEGRFAPSMSIAKKTKRASAICGRRMCRRRCGRQT